MRRFQELELNPTLLRGLQEVGFDEPFPIQERAIGPLLMGRDVVGQAKTGSGKTAAFGLPMLQKVNPNFREVQALVLAPTRELAVQIVNELRKLGKYSGVRITPIYGGQAISVQEEALERGTQIVVGTPGRMIDLMKRGSLILDDVHYVVLDEADTMLDMGFVEDVEFILDSIPLDRQLSLFSATMPEPVLNLSKRYMKNPVNILIDSGEPSVETLDQYFTIASEEEKFDRLVHILNNYNPRSAIIFCATRYRTRKLGQHLADRGYDAVSLHGDLSQKQRDFAMGSFRHKKASILVATDVAARGIDVSRVEHVINYDIPNDPLMYFHRVGRTARAGNSGMCITFVTEEQGEQFSRIQGLTDVRIKPLTPSDVAPRPLVPRIEDPGHRGRFDVRRRRNYGRSRPRLALGQGFGSNDSNTGRSERSRLRSGGGGRRRGHYPRRREFRTSF
jgi:ATP-dependent RNA helicase DeaD